MMTMISTTTWKCRLLTILTKDSNGYTEEDGGLNDAIDMIFGKDGEEDFEFDDFEDNDNSYDDED